MSHAATTLDLLDRSRESLTSGVRRPAASARYLAASLAALRAGAALVAARSATRPAPGSPPAATARTTSGRSPPGSPPSSPSGRAVRRRHRAAGRGRDRPGAGHRPRGRRPAARRRDLRRPRRRPPRGAVACSGRGGSSPSARPEGVDGRVRPPPRRLGVLDALRRLDARAPRRARRRARPGRPRAHRPRRALRRGPVRHGVRAGRHRAGARRRPRRRAARARRAAAPRWPGTGPDAARRVRVAHPGARWRDRRPPAAPGHRARPGPGRRHRPRGRLGGAVPPGHRDPPARRAGRAGHQPDLLATWAHPEDPTSCDLPHGSRSPGPPKPWQVARRREGAPSRAGCSCCSAPTPTSAGRCSPGAASGPATCSRPGGRCCRATGSPSRSSTTAARRAPPGAARTPAHLLALADAAGLPAVLTAAVRHADPDQVRTVDLLDAARRLVVLDSRHLDRVTDAGHLASTAAMHASALEVTGGDRSRADRLVAMTCPGRRRVHPAGPPRPRHRRGAPARGRGARHRARHRPDAGARPALPRRGRPALPRGQRGRAAGRARPARRRARASSTPWATPPTSSPSPRSPT